MSFEKFFRGEVVKEFFSARPLIVGVWLCDEIGYGPAKDALEAMNTIKDVPIWKLGEKVGTKYRISIVSSCKQRR